MTNEAGDLIVTLRFDHESQRARVLEHAERFRATLPDLDHALRAAVAEQSKRRRNLAAQYAASASGK